jgi:hypothetical protein
MGCSLNTRDLTHLGVGLENRLELLGLLLQRLLHSVQSFGFDGSHLLRGILLGGDGFGDGVLEVDQSLEESRGNVACGGNG